MTKPTPEGIKQGESLAKTLKSNGNSAFFRIITSDLKRALSTAEILAYSPAVPVIKEPTLKEINNKGVIGYKGIAQTGRLLLLCGIQLLERETL